MKLSIYNEGKNKIVGEGLLAGLFYVSFISSSTELFRYFFLLGFRQMLTLFIPQKAGSAAYNIWRTCLLGVARQERKNIETILFRHLLKFPLSIISSFGVRTKFWLGGIICCLLFSLPVSGSSSSVPNGSFIENKIPTPVDAPVENRKEYVRSVKKEYDISADGEVYLKNEHGKVNIHTWEKIESK